MLVSLLSQQRVLKIVTTPRDLLYRSSYSRTLVLIDLLGSPGLVQSKRQPPRLVCYLRLSPAFLASLPATTSDVPPLIRPHFICYQFPLDDLVAT